MRRGKPEIGRKGGLWVKVGSVPIDPVWVAPLGELYHRQECEFLGDDNSMVARESAVERGLRACPECEP
jgi:hypothetical protein